MKIVFFQRNFRAAGVERVNILLANEMVKIGYEVSFIVFSNDGEFKDYLSDEIKVQELKIDRTILSIPYLFKYFLKNRVKFISAYNYLSIIAILINIFTFKKSDIYVCEHNTLSSILKVKGRWKDYLIAKLLPFFYAHTKAVIAVSKGVANDLSKHFGIKKNKIKVLYNPVVSTDMLIRAKEIPNHPWFLDKTKPVFIACGRLEPQKNFTLLIEAFSKVAEKVDARLLILGDGKQKDLLLNQIEMLRLVDKCELVGFVDNPYKFIAHADVFVLSSDFEGLPTVLIEALACNTKVVSTDCPSGAAEILENGKWGRLVPVGDLEELSKAMITSLNEKNSANLMARADFFSVRSSTQKYINFISQ